ncbi:MAG: glycosyltransferase family 4 protein [Clostridium sp.]|nr:glycosyltransferase family 4 protein [Clostridium sp.]
MTGICFFIGDMKRSGGTERVTEQVSALLCSDYRTHIVSLQNLESDFFYMPKEEVTTHTILKKPHQNIQKAVLAFPYIFVALARYINRHHIDIVIDVDSVLDLFTIPLKLFCKIRVVSWAHFPFRVKVGTGFRPLVERLSNRFCDATVVLTSSDYTAMKAVGKRKGFLYYIPNMVYPKDRMPPSDAQRILSVGRLTYEKGFDYLVEVAKLVLPKHPQWQWVIVGEGEERASLQQKIQDVGLEDRILLVGRQKDIEAYYESAAIYVMTSRFEGAPMVLLEALGERLPTISFDCETGPGEMIEDGTSGYLIPCFHIEEMAKRIEELIDFPEKREAFSRASLTKIGDFTVEIVAKQWKKLLEELS